MLNLVQHLFFPGSQLSNLFQQEILKRVQDDMTELVAISRAAPALKCFSFAIGFPSFWDLQFSIFLMIGTLKKETPSSFKMTSSSVVAVPFIFLFSTSPEWILRASL